MVLYVFVVAYVGGGEQLASGAVLRVLGPLFALALAVELCIAMLGAGLKGVSSKGAPYVPGFGTPAHIGKLFLTQYLFPFELASILLLVAAIGAVVLARRRRGLEPEEQIAFDSQPPRARPTPARWPRPPACARSRTRSRRRPRCTPVGETTDEAAAATGQPEGGW